MAYVTLKTINQEANLKSILFIGMVFLAGCASMANNGQASSGTNNPEIRQPSSDAGSVVPQSWSCTAHTGMMNARTTIARIEKSGNGYSIYITDGSDDTGPTWSLKDQLVAKDAQCKFSRNSLAPIYCESSGDGWATLRAEDEIISYVDQTTGEDKSSKFTSVMLSGTSPYLKHYQNNVMKFAAKDCTRN